MIEVFAKNRLFGVEEDKNISIELIAEKDGVSEYKITLEYDKPTPVKDALIRWLEPMRGILSVWLPKLGKTRQRQLFQWFYKSHDTSSFCSGAPILCTCDKDQNFQTFALSDADNTHDLAVYVDDFAEKDNVCMQLLLFNKETIIKEYSTILRIDTREIPFYDSIKDVTKWWNSLYERKVFNTEFAEYPLYSTWYNFHQHPKGDLLEKELEIAKDLGFKTVIIDDGWQYDGNGTGDYFDCGRWEVSKEKFADFGKFVDKIHSFDMQVAVWFPVPFVGYNTAEYQKLKDKMLYNSEFYRAGIVDPRYPEIRQYLVNTFKDFMAKYSLDGLKLDFIDDFKATEQTPAYNDKMDFVKVGDAVEQLLLDITTELKKVKSDLLIEFRQAYVGPSIVRFCNMLRVGDCAFDSLTNRIAVTDLRLPEYDLAVHSDMLYWSKHETLANVKKQLLNVFFSVPQISVLLTQSSSDQLELIKQHLKYWQQNKEIILHGKFKVQNLEHNYPVISSENDEKRIAVLHDVYDYSCFDKNVDLINAGTKDLLYLDVDKNAIATVYDMINKEIARIELYTGVNKVNVPIGGRVEVRF